MNVMMISPHPDDIELFCGGTMLKHYFAEDRVAVVMVTSGGKGTILPWRRGERLERIRREEACARYSRLSGVEVEWLGLQDGEVRVSDASLDLVRKSLQKFLPDIVYLPECESGHATYYHRDHRQSAQLVERAAKASGRRICLRYYHTRKYDLFLDISEYFVQNQAALSHYRSQSSCWANPPCLLPILALWQRRVRTLQGKLANCRYAEAFRLNQISRIERTGN